MGTVDDGRAPQSGVSSLGGYVHDPTEVAESLLEAEKSELLAEREAFRIFAERVRKTDARSVSHGKGRPILDGDQSNDSLVTRVRNHYRDTVLAVDHYDVAYGEPLAVNVASELGTGLGILLEPGSGVQFSPLFKEQLVAVAVEASEARGSFLAEIKRERDDVEDHRDKLADLLDESNAAVTSSRSRDGFETELDGLVRRRQETIHGHRSIGNDRSLCGYLYADAPWTHPVLTAASRLYEALTL